jgi:hypothetical protein
MLIRLTSFGVIYVAVEGCRSIRRRGSTIS